MSRYQYDDFRLTFAGRDGDSYPLRAEHGGRSWRGEFVPPMSAVDLEAAVLSMAARCGCADATRDVGSGGPPEVDAVQLGAALATALFAGEIGFAYGAAVDAVDRRDGRGLRLTLSLAEAPELLDVPWEFLFRRPTFLAVQPHLPVVRHVEVGPIPEPPLIDDVIRVLGVVASPSDLSPLDVGAERRRVEQAVAPMRALGRVQVDWLEPATPRGLRQALRDGRYHVVHYVGHSDFETRADGTSEGSLFLEDPDSGRAARIDSTMLANLLDDQAQLQLVVLNSCRGARTTLADPFAGVATTLIQSGVPAVVAMQFEISDGAAIVFAEELYTNLIGRQDPIDAAVAEARKAIFVEVDELEWATPVLFLRDPEIELFCFAVAAAATLPPPEPMDLLIPSVAPLTRAAGTGFPAPAASDLAALASAI